MESGERMSYSIAAVSLAATMKDRLPHFWSKTHTPNYCTLSDSFNVQHFSFKKWKKRKSEKQFARVPCFLDVKLAASVQTWTFRLILQKNWKLAEHKFLELRRMQEISGTKLSPDILNLVIIWLACKVIEIQLGSFEAKYFSIWSANIRLLFANINSCKVHFCCTNICLRFFYLKKAISFFFFLGGQNGIPLWAWLSKLWLWPCVGIFTDNIDQY